MMNSAFVGANCYRFWMVCQFESLTLTFFLDCFVAVAWSGSLA